MLTREAPSQTTDDERHESGRRAVSVCVWTNQTVVRVGLTTMLETPDDSIDVTVVPHHDDADVVLFDVAVLDTEPGMAQCWRASSPTPVIAVDWASRPDLGERARAAGIDWGITLGITCSELHQVVRDAAAGTTREHQIASAWTKETFPGQAAGLSRRQAEVLGLIASGLSNDGIARQVAVSINSVKSYIRAAYRKIEVTSRSQAVAWALRHGLGGSPQEAILGDLGPRPDTPWPRAR